MKIIVASDLHLSPPQSRIGGWDSRRGSYASWLEPNDRLGEIVFADLPQVGDSVEAGETCGEVESTKSVSDLYSPVTGTVTAVNQEALDDCAIINGDPFTAGWLFEVEVTEVGPLLTAAEYAEKNGV